VVVVGMVAVVRKGGWRREGGREGGQSSVVRSGTEDALLPLKAATSEAIDNTCHPQARRR